jgi:hypothetical protein
MKREEIIIHSLIMIEDILRVYIDHDQELNNGGRFDFIILLKEGRFFKSHGCPMGDDHSWNLL